VVDFYLLVSTEVAASTEAGTSGVGNNFTYVVGNIN
jgi:hypothetical protein